MTSWMQLPWRTIRDRTGLEAAETLSDAVDSAMPHLHAGGWRTDASNGRMTAEWKQSFDTDDVEAVETTVTIRKWSVSKALVHVELCIETMVDLPSEAVVRCHPDLIDPLLDEPSRLVELIGSLMRRAAESSDPLPLRPPQRRRHADFGPGDAMDLAEAAMIHDMDATLPMRIEAWEATPLSPKTRRIVGSGREALEHAAQDVETGAVRLSKKVGGAAWLQPETSFVIGDGFDAMDLLRIHRALDERGRS